MLLEYLALLIVPSMHNFRPFLKAAVSCQCSFAILAAYLQNVSDVLFDNNYAKM